MPIQIEIPAKQKRAQIGNLPVGRFFLHEYGSVKRVGIAVYTDLVLRSVDVMFFKAGVDTGYIERLPQEAEVTILDNITIQVAL